MERRPRYTACQTCRSRKRRCVRVEGEPCALCKEAGRSCSALEDAYETEGEDITQNTLLEHFIDLFFRYLHDPVLTIFHKPTFMMRLHQGTIQSYILHIIAALAARFSEDASLVRTDPRERGKSYFDTGLRLLKLSIDDVSIDVIHGCMLAAHYLSGHNMVEQEAVYVGVAIRIAHLLHLQEEPNTGDAIEDEIRRRAWSILFAADRWSALGNGIPRITGMEYYTDKPLARKPMPDIEFLQLTSDSQQVSNAIGIWAPNRDLHDIASLTHSHHLAVLYNPTSPEASIYRIDEISLELQKWQNKLPSHFQFTPQNVYRQSSLSFGAIFLGTHISFHYNYVVLLYQFLSYSDAKSQKYADLLKYHASKISEIMRWSNKLPDCKLHYSVIAHILVISSSVHLHTLLYGDMEAAKLAKEDLDTNFEHIMALRRLWPAVDVSAARLRIFEAACLTSTNQNIWRMDRWLVKFLLQHTKYMDEDRNQEPEVIAIDQRLSRGTVNNEVEDSSNHRIVEQALSWLITADPFMEYPTDLFSFEYEAPLRRNV